MSTVLLHRETFRKTLNPVKVHKEFTEKTGQTFYYVDTAYSVSQGIQLRHFKNRGTKGLFFVINRDTEINEINLYQGPHYSLKDVIIAFIENKMNIFYLEEYYYGYEFKHYIIFKDIHVKHMKIHDLLMFRETFSVLKQKYLWSDIDKNFVSIYSKLKFMAELLPEEYDEKLKRYDKIINKIKTFFEKNE